MEALRTGPAVVGSLKVSVACYIIPCICPALTSARVAKPDRPGLAEIGGSIRESEAACGTRPQAPSFFSLRVQLLRAFGPESSSQ